MYCYENLGGRIMIMLFLLLTICVILALAVSAGVGIVSLLFGWPGLIILIVLIIVGIVSNSKKK